MVVIATISINTKNISTFTLWVIALWRELRDNDSTSRHGISSAYRGGGYDDSWTEKYKAVPGTAMRGKKYQKNLTGLCGRRVSA